MRPTYGRLIVGHSQIFSNFRASFPKVQQYVIIWFLIFNFTGDSLILEKLFSRSSFYDIACFSIFASGPHFDATITSENIFRSSSIDAIIFDCGPLTMDTSLVLMQFLVGLGFHL